MGNNEIKFASGQLARELFGETDLKMLHLALSPTITQEELDSALEGWDAGKAPFRSLTIASNLADNHPEVSFPKEARPILHKARIMCRERYLTLLPHFVKIIQALDNKQIPFLILKGGAMKAYRPEFPRWMSDIDILILDERFQDALDAVRDQGYILGICPHSAGLRDPVSRQNVVDLHRFIQMGSGKERKYNVILKQRSVSMPLSSLNVRVPSPEDMVFISLVNFWKNFTNKTSERSVANACFDLKFLKDLNGSLDWETIRSNALLTETVETVYLAAGLLDGVIPDYFPSRFLEDAVDLKKAERVLSRTLRVRNVLCPLHDRIGEFNIMKAIKERKPFFKYIYLRLKYFLLKRIPFLLP